ncbi:MAG: SMC-Scp complex subunit ScpB [Planctomycetes bacterium]|nr:SMC-Scp complex subunit ScpB [Planctomycetota bacterium]
MPEMKQIVEALLFACEEPLAPSKIREVMGSGTPTEVRGIVEALNAEYDAQGRPYQVQEIAGGFQVATRPEYGEWIAKLDTARESNRLTAAALETLAIIAYRQPILRAEVEAIRGVQSGPILRALMDRDLVRMTGRSDKPGAPMLYGTTDRFLETFGLKSIKDLPRAEELK